MRASLPLVTKPWMYNPLLWVRALLRITMSPRAHAHLGYTETIPYARLCQFRIPALLQHPERLLRAGKMQKCVTGLEKVPLQTSHRKEHLSPQSLHPGVIGGTGDIGTALPSQAPVASAPHHLLINPIPASWLDPTPTQPWIINFTPPNSKATSEQAPIRTTNLR